MESVSKPNHLWSIVLAAGDGKRVRDLTIDRSGRSVPKQFCLLDGRDSLLRWTVNRAHRVVSSEQIVAVVADQHRRLWEPELFDLTPQKTSWFSRRTGVRRPDSCSLYSGY